SGTSMAAPSVTGSLFLLQELYSKKHNGRFMKSASLKGVAIHTADEAGNAPGPDYQFGWGLLNDKTSADFVVNANKSDTIIETTLNNGDTFKYSFVASGFDKVKATLVWTDAPAGINYAYRLNNPATKLINDLDVVIVSNSKTYQPWVLNPSLPSQAAYMGNNSLDNVERVDIDTTIQGNLYTVIVTHKGILQRGSQAFSLVLSGINGDSACVSKPLSTAGLTIDSVSVTNLHIKNNSGCTSYTDNRLKVASIEPHQSVPFNIRLGNCGGSLGANDVVKIFVDYNHNGSFSDPGEQVATSTVIVSNNTFSGSFTTPYSMAIGSKLTMRIVAVETNDTSTVHPCGLYGNGETQDISLQVVPPANDVAVTDIISPADSSCNGSTLIAAEIKNNGSGILNNIPLSLVVKNGSTTIAIQNVVCKSIVNPGDLFVYTFPVPVSLLASATYTISVVSNLASDQDSTNNSYAKTIVTAVPVGLPEGVGEICTASNYAILQVVNSNSNTNYYWYNSSLNDVPIATGTTANSSNITANHTYYLTTGITTQGIGLSSKNVFPGGGGYSQLAGNNNYFRYSSNTNIVLQSARIYTGYPGKITISAGDFSGSNFIASATVSVNAAATLASPVKGTYMQNDPADTGAVYVLNLPLHSGSHYIVISTDTNATVFTNNNVTGNPYPMGNTNAIALVNNSASSYQNNYLGLYALKLATVNCPSAKVPVVVNSAKPLVVTHAHDTLFSSYPNNNQWYQDGSTIMFANDNYLVVTDSAMYSVSATDSMGCSQTSAGFLYDPKVLYLDTSNHMLDSIYAFSLNPSPFINNTLGIKFTLKGKSDVKVYIVNALGQLCLYKEYPGFSGNFNQQL
ncbi:MAG: GEVED domain-containing protein, partial [Bacteroidota bacterium]